MGYYDFETDNAELLRQKQMAEALRQRANAGVPQAQMVGGYYVAPHWSNNVANLFNQVMAARAEGQYGEAQKAQAQKVADARQQWAAALPQAVAEKRESLPFTDDEGNPYPEAVTPAKPVTTAQILKHTLEGMRIPGNEKVAELYSKGALAEVDREDKQVEAARKQLEDARTRRERLEAEANLKLELEAQRARDKEASDRRHDETLKELARIRASGGGGAGGDKAANWKQEVNADGTISYYNVLTGERKESGGVKAKPQSDKARRELDSHDALSTGMQEALEALNNASGRGMGWAAGVAQNAIPGGTAVVNMFRDENTKKADQLTSYWAGEIQHGRFGATLTPSEKANAATYLPNEFDSKREKIRKLKGLQGLIDLNNSRLRAGMTEPPAGTPTAPPARTNPQSARGSVTNNPVVAPTAPAAPGWKLRP